MYHSNCNLVISVSLVVFIVIFICKILIFAIQSQEMFAEELCCFFLLGGTLNLIVYYSVGNITKMKNKKTQNNERFFKDLMITDIAFVCSKIII